MPRLRPHAAPRAALLLAAGLAAPLPAAAEVVLRAGDAAAAHAELAFAPGPEPRTLRVTTRAAGVAGSRLTIGVDRSPVPALDHVFAEDECRFPEGGASVCEIIIGDADPALAVIVQSFRLGREAHVRVQDAGVMRMDHGVSLIGFTRSLDG